MKDAKSGYKGVKSGLDCGLSGMWGSWVGVLGWGVVKLTGVELGWFGIVMGATVGRVPGAKAPFSPWTFFVGLKPHANPKDKNEDEADDA